MEFFNRFRPPKDENIDQELGITTLNTLIRVGNWSSLSHIDVKYDNLKISAERVLRDLVTDHNFHLKKQYFNQMVRCRFLEVILNYNTLFSTLSVECRNEKFVNLISYVKCVVRLFEVLNDTINMFGYMLTIIEKLRLSSVWSANKTCSSLYTAKKWIQIYVRNLKNDNLIRDTFVNKPDVNIHELADEYLKIFQLSRTSFVKTFFNQKYSKSNHCCIEGFMLYKRDLIYKLLHDARKTNGITSHNTCANNYEFICKLLEQYCTYFIKSDYIDTGFNRVNKDYFWRWV